MAILLSLSLGALGLIALPAAAATSGTGRQVFYVSPRGDDANPGTAGAPFRTLTHAQQVVRRLNGDMRGNLTVKLYGGTYRLSDPLNFTAADSGTGGHDVVYEAVNGQHPVISGARRVTGWKLSDPANGIYRAYVGKDVATRQLYVNGQRAIRASGNPSTFQETADGFVPSNSSMLSWPDIVGTELTGEAAWRLYRCPVASVSGDTLVMAQPCWGNAHQESSSIQFHNVSSVENAYELLDNPNEWYLDQSTGFLYYKPSAGEKMATADVELPVLQSLMQGDGTVDAPIHNLTFRNLTFAYATWLEPSTNQGYTPLQSGIHYGPGPNPAWNHDGWYGEATPGNVEFSYDRDLTFDHNVFTDLGAYGLQLGTGTQGAAIVGNRFQDISSGGIELGGIQPVDHHPDDPRAITKDNAISNNVVTNAGLEYPDSNGIFLGYVANTSVTQNDVMHLPYSGITLGWGWGSTDLGSQNPTYPSYGGPATYTTATTNHDNAISGNRVYDVMTMLRDGAPIYTLGASPGTVITRNYVHQAVNAQAGLYPDEGSANVQWTDNVIQDPTRRWIYIWTSSIHDLTVSNNYTDDPTYVNNGKNITMEDNTVVENGNWPAAACQIAANSGLEPQYEDVLGPNQAPPGLC